MPGIVKIAATALAFAVSGCALANDTPPSIDVMSVKLVGIGLTEQQLAVTLCVTNPNANQIAFRRVTAGFDVSGTPLAVGESALAVQLPPQASAVVPFAVVTTVRNLGPQLLGILRSGNVDYRVHGTVTLRGMGLTLPYSRSGRLDPLAMGLDLVSSAADPVPSRCSEAARQASGFSDREDGLGQIGTPLWVKSGSVTQAFTRSMASAG